ncbi:MAG: TatD family hydrolase [Actinomycetota bacterium]
MRWIDNHCHLDPGADGDAQIEQAAEAGVVRFIDVGTDAARNRQTIAAAERRAGTVFATVGVHPHDATEGIDGLADHLDHPGVVAVGECGLDYHYDHSPRDVQREVFAAQIGLAHEHDLPLVIHTREAWDETFAILDSEGMPDRTVFHCFTGGPAEAEAGLERGGLLSFSGIVTFKNAQELREALAISPIDRVMVETDSPYLTPEPHRGKRNTPANVPLVGRRMAEVLGAPVAELADQVWDTTHRFYGLPALDVAPA